MDIVCSDGHGIGGQRVRCQPCPGINCPAGNCFVEGDTFTGTMNSCINGHAAMGIPSPDGGGVLLPSGSGGVGGALPYKPMDNKVPTQIRPKTPRRRAKRKRFSGMNPVRQRPIGVNPSQGGFFSVPSGERNFGQQASLPYDQQLNMNHKSNFVHSNFAHSNASGCGYSNMNHSNFAHSNFVRGGNTGAIWSGAQTNVGPQDRVFAGNYASGRHHNMNHKSNFAHSNFAHSNASGCCG